MAIIINGIHNNVGLNLEISNADNPKTANTYSENTVTSGAKLIGVNNIKPNKVATNTPGPKWNRDKQSRQTWDVNPIQYPLANF